MPLKITHRKADEVPPQPSLSGRVNDVLAEIMRELTKLAPGMVLVIETGDEKAIRATKTLITRAGNELGMPMRHWHSGTAVYAKPAAEAARGKQRSERANLRDLRD